MRSNSPKWAACCCSWTFARPGTIGTIHNTTVNSNVQQLGDIQGDLFGLLASRPRELSEEGPQFGGGHGAFSYFVIKGLEGAADANKDGIVDADELIKYVSDQVPMATANKQHPREFGNYDNMMRLSDVKKPGIDVAHWRVLLDSRNGGPLYLAAAGAPGQLPSAQPPASVERFSAALNAGRILPTDPDNAFTALADLKASRRAGAIPGARESTPRRARRQGPASSAALSGRRRDAAVPQGIREWRALHGGGTQVDAGVAVPGGPPGFL